MPKPPEETSPSPATEPQHRIGITLMLMSTVAFAVMAVCAKMASEHVGSAFTILSRSAVVLAILLPFMRLRGVPLLGRGNLYLHMRCFFGALSMHLYYYALKGAPLAECVVLANTAPLFIPLVSYYIVGEIPRFGLIAIIAIGFVGIAILVGPPLEQFRVHLLAAAGTGFSGAIALTSLQRASSHDDPSTIVFTFALWTLALSLPFSWTVTLEAIQSAWIPLLGLGLLSVPAQLLLTAAMRRSSAGILGVFNYFGVVLNFALGMYFFNEIPGPWTYVGAFFVITACLLVSRFAPKLIRYRR